MDGILFCRTPTKRELKDYFGFIKFFHKLYINKKLTIIKNLKNLVRSSQLAVLILLFIQLSSKNVLAQYHVNYSPLINFGYTSEKAFCADVNNDNYTDIILHNSISGTVTALKHNTNLNAIEFVNPFSIGINNEILIDVKQLDGATGADLISYRPGATIDEIIGYYSNPTSFANGVTICTLAHGDYQFGTIDINNDGKFDIYALNKTTSTFYYCIVNAAATLPLTFTSFSLPTIPANGIVHLFTGHFQSTALTDICYVIEEPTLGNSNYFVNVLVNNGSSLVNGASTNNYNYVGSPNQQFYTGKFTNDNYSDLLILVDVSSDIYVLGNINGSGFPNFNSWNTNYSTNLQNSFSVGNYDKLQSLDEFMIIKSNEPSNLGQVDLQVSRANSVPQENRMATTNLPIEPCNGPGNPLTTQAADYITIPADFNNDNQADYLLYSPSQSFLKVGVIKRKVEGYCWPQSAKVNQTIDFYLSSEAMLDISVVKLESRNANLTEVSTLISQTLSPGEQPFLANTDIVAQGCGWSSSYTLTIPNGNGWGSGFYALKIKPSGSNCDYTYIHFVVNAENVNSANSKKVALIANTNTWAAYNIYSNSISSLGSKYLYSYDKSSFRDYSFMRPLVGNGNEMNNTTTPHMARAELWIYTWLKDNGYDPDVISDMDVHINANNFLNNYDYLVIGTHPEYWTGQMYGNVKNFQTNGSNGKGGNLICLGGNAVFEVVDLNLGTPANPKLIAYPNSPGGATLQQNIQYPLPNPWTGVGGSINPSPSSSPTGIIYDRFDYFNESFNFGTDASPSYKRTIDLTAVHYQNINSIPGNNTSYTVNQASHPLMTGIVSGIIGANGYCKQNGIDGSGGAGASGWECDRYSPAVSPDGGITPASPLQTTSVYDNDLQILATATTIPTFIAPWSYPYNINGIVCPNGMNNSEIVYVPPHCSSPKRGFVFTAGSITFGGSLVWNYNAITNTYNNDLSRLMKNVLSHTEFVSNIFNVNCSGSNTGSITLVPPPLYQSNTLTYLLMPNNVSNTTGVFTGLTAGTYSITVSNTAGGTNYSVYCREHTIDNIPLGNFCCSPQAENLITSTPNLILKIAPLASDLVAQYGNTITGKTFYIDDLFTIDQNITFNNCTLWFTPTGQVQLQGPVNFTTNNTTLQAACDWWQGIVANDPQQKVKVEGGSHIKNAIVGVNISNNAVLEASNSFFEDNGYASISFSVCNATNNSSYVKGNTFTSGNTLPAPYFKTERGIAIGDVAQINIGDVYDASSGNSFDGMQIGIHLGESNTGGVNYIGLYNNTFSNIHATLPQGLSPSLAQQYIVDKTYTEPWGSSIYANYAQSNNQITQQCYLTIKHTNTPTTNTFANCDRGIVSIGANTYANKQQMDNCLLGIMCQSPYKRNYQINDNTVLNAHMGIQLFGKQLYSEIERNVLSLNTAVLSQVGPVSITPPVGIKVQQGQMSFNAPVAYKINENTIDIKTITGVGIYNAYGDMQAQTKGNTIQFSSNSTASTQSHKIRTLIGVWADKCSEADFDDNNSHGFTSPTLYDARNSYGMYMDNSPWCRWSCNKADYIRYGFYVWGNNETKTDKVTFNRLDYNEYPWFFLDGAAAQPGTFGSIGDPNAGGTEPANEYMNVAGIGTLNYNPNLYKVYRYSSINNGNQIATNPSFLDLTESGSLGAFAEYGVGPNINPYVNPCTNFNIGNTNNEGDDGSYETYIQDVVADSISYINYNQVASWMDRYKVYRDLDVDSLLRNSDAALQNFYTYNALQNIGKLRATERAIQLLYDSTTNSSNFSDRYNAALQANANIISGEDWELKEQAINHAMILLSALPADSLPQSVKDDIGTIAQLCPYVGGNGVLKARTLWMHWQPNALWDDRVLCMQGQNKNQDNSDMDIDSLYASVIKESNVNNNIAPIVIRNDENKNKLIASEAHNNIQVYPNPASQFVIISYESQTNGYFRIFNSIGELILETELAAYNTKTQIPLSNLANGIYQYEVGFANKIKTMGKLSILK